MNPIDPGASSSQPIRGETDAVSNSPPSEKAQGRTRGQKRVREKEVPEARRHSARPTSKPVTTPLPKRVKVVDQNWLSPTLSAENKVIFPESAVVSSKKYRVSSEDLQELTSKHPFTVEAKAASSGVAGTGVFATKNFVENELVGVYEGRLVKHKQISDEVYEHFCKVKNIPTTFFKERPMVAWYEDEEGCHFSAAPDSHTLWSGITVSRKNVELGVDGLWRGNALAFLNHSDVPNVKPIPVFTRANAIKTKDCLYAKAESYAPDDLLICIVATQAISEGTELFFNYKRKSKGIDFKKVGYDVFPEPHKYALVKGDDVSFSTDRADVVSEDGSDTSEAPSEAETRGPFDENMTDNQKRMSILWLTEPVIAKKEIVDAIIHDGDQDMLKLYIYLCNKHYLLIAKDIFRGIPKSHRHALEGSTSSVSALKSFIREHFSPEDAAPILGLKSVPGTKRLTAAQPATTTESHELLDNIREHRANAHESMCDYLRKAIYRSERKLGQAPIHCYKNAQSALIDKDGILGHPKGYWNVANIYDFMVVENLFDSEDDRIRYMPIVYLDDCFKSTSSIKQGKGKKALQDNIVWRLKHDEQINTILKILNSVGVFNPLHGNSHWTEVDLLTFPPVNSFLSQKDSGDVAQRVLNWQEVSSRAKQLDALKALKSDLSSKKITLSEVVFQMAKLGMTVDRIRIVGHPLSSFHPDNPDNSDNFKWEKKSVLSLIYQGMPKVISPEAGVTLEKQVEWMGDAVHLCYQQANEYLKRTSKESIDKDFFSKELLTLLEKELDEKISHTAYQKYWTELLIKTRSPQAHKIMLDASLRHKKVNQVWKDFSSKKIPILPASSTETKGTEWNLPNLFINIYDNGLINRKDSKGQHFAVLAAAYTDLKMVDHPSDPGKTFEQFLEQALKEYEYASVIVGKLRARHYAAAGEPVKRMRRKKK